MFQLHFVLETLGYLAGAVVYSLLRKRRGDVLSDPARIDVLVGAAIGAAIGSRLLFWLSDPALTLQHLSDARYLLGGKTVVGGLLGGWIGVEIAKKVAGIPTRTGDLFVLPLITALAIGRVGCFLTGPADHTAGDPSNVPWAMAMGDSVRRHPVALYEIAFLLVLAFALRRVGGEIPGAKFRAFLTSYLAFRFLVDFLKPEPQPLVAGVTAIQLACLAGLAFYAATWSTTFARQQPATNPS